MIMFVWGIIVGLLVWQLITTAAFIANDEDEEITSKVGGGAILFMAWVITHTLTYIAAYIRYCSVRSILTDGNVWYYCKSKDADYIIEKSEILNFPKWNKDLQKQYPITMWGKYFQEYGCNNHGNFRYAPKTIWKNLPEIKR